MAENKIMDEVVEPEVDTKVINVDTTTTDDTNTNVEVDTTTTDDTNTNVEVDTTTTEKSYRNEQGLTIWETNIEAKRNLDKFVSNANKNYYFGKVFSFSTFSEEEYNTKFEKIDKILNIKIKAIEDKTQYNITKVIQALKDKCNQDIYALSKKTDKEKNVLELKLKNLENGSIKHEEKNILLAKNLNVLMTNDNEDDNTAKYVMDFLQPASAKTIGINIPSIIDNDLSSIYANSVGKAFTRFSESEKEDYMLKMYRKYNSEIHSVLREYNETSDLEVFKNHSNLDIQLISHVFRSIIQETISLKVLKILNDIEDLNKIAIVPLVDSETIKNFREELTNSSRSIEVMGKLAELMKIDGSDDFKTGEEQEELILNDFTIKYFNAEFIPEPVIIVEVIEEAPVSENLNISENENTEDDVIIIKDKESFEEDFNSLSYEQKEQLKIASDNFEKIFATIMKSKDVQNSTEIK